MSIIFFEPKKRKTEYLKILQFSIFDINSGCDVRIISCDDDVTT